MRRHVDTPCFPVPLAGSVGRRSRVGLTFFDTVDEHRVATAAFFCVPPSGSGTLIILPMTGADRFSLTILWDQLEKVGGVRLHGPWMRAVGSPSAIQSSSASGEPIDLDW
jgi:hypothetical protein